MKLYDIGKAIKTLRKDKGLTQAKLAGIAGISRVTLGKLERGEVASVSIKVLDLILDTLDFEIDIISKKTNTFGLDELTSY